MFTTCQTEIFYRLLNECAEEVKIKHDITSGVREFINSRVMNNISLLPCDFSNRCEVNIQEIFKEMKTLLDYTNECIQYISTTYTKSRSSTFILRENFQLNYSIHL